MSIRIQITLNNHDESPVGSVETSIFLNDTETAAERATFLLNTVLLQSGLMPPDAYVALVPDEDEEEEGEEEAEWFKDIIDQQMKTQRKEDHEKSIARKPDDGLDPPLLFPNTDADKD